MLPDDLEPLSPELVLVCPELRELALLRERDAVRAPFTVVERAPEPARARSARSFTAVVLAVSLGLGGYVLGRERAETRAERQSRVAAPAAVQTWARAGRNTGVLSRRARRCRVGRAEIVPCQSELGPRTPIVRGRVRPD